MTNIFNSECGQTILKRAFAFVDLNLVRHVSKLNWNSDAVNNNKWNGCERKNESKKIATKSVHYAQIHWKSLREYRKQSKRIDAYRCRYPLESTKIFSFRSHLHEKSIEKKNLTKSATLHRNALIVKITFNYAERKNKANSPKRIDAYRYRYPLESKENISFSFTFASEKIWLVSSNLQSKVKQSDFV